MSKAALHRGKVAKVHLKVDTGMAALARAGDVLVAVSHSGHSPEVMKAVQLARENGAAVIAITANRKSPLCTAADLVVPYQAEETMLETGSISVKIAQFFIMAAAKVVAGQIYLKPDSVLGLATGSTPLQMYGNLVAVHQTIGLDFSEVTSFNLDEYIGLAPDNPQSYHYFMPMQKPLRARRVPRAITLLAASWPMKLMPQSREATSRMRLWLTKRQT